MKRKSLILLSLVVLGLFRTGFAQERKLRDVLERIEIGTNLIPLVDSTTLKFDNLMVKYFYGRERDRAVRVNLILNSIELEDVDKSGFIYDSDISFQFGHIWYGKLNPKISPYMAVDFVFTNNSRNSFLISNSYDISRWNKYRLLLTGGIKYIFYKNLSLEFETSMSVELKRYYTNEPRDVQNNSNYFNILFYEFLPINCLTFNYKF